MAAKALNGLDEAGSHGRATLTQAAMDR